MTEPSPAGSVLGDLKVVDFTMGWAGPLTTELLADFGAEVIKIESVTRTDWWRTARRLFVGDEPDPELFWEQSPMFNSVNLGKLGVTLDLNHPAGLDLARRLIARADVVVENFTPRVMRTFGLSYDELRILNPRLIMVSMPGFGLDGPWRDYRSTALVTESAAGVTAQCGYPEREPQIVSMSPADSNAGIIGALAVVLALRHRRRTGEGQHIEVAQLEAMVPHLGAELLGYQLEGTLPKRRGNASPHRAPHGCYPAAGVEQWIVLSVPDDARWGALAELIGSAEAADPRWRTARERIDHHAELDVIVGTWTATKDRDWLVRELQARGIAAAPVQDAVEVLRDPHLAATGFFHRMKREIVGEHPYAGVPVRLSRTPAVRRRPAPLLGEHNDHVLGVILGLPQAELATLAEAGVIGRTPRGEKPTAEMAR